MISIVDYGVGNIASLLTVFEYIGVDAAPVSDPEQIACAEKLVLPGVGAFDKAMANLAHNDLIEPIRMAVLDRGAHLLGICLGMQLLTRGSEEGQLRGLGLLQADTVRISSEMGVKVPHVGWSGVTRTDNAPLFGSDAQRFYFTHSFWVRCDDRTDVAATINYGETICVAVSKGNIHGAQFHPEKSHRFGVDLLTRFAHV